jgi:hypothetical protein
MEVLEKKVKTDDWGSVAWSKLDEGIYKVFSVTEVSTGEKVPFYELPFHLCLPKQNTLYLIEYAIK